MQFSKSSDYQKYVLTIREHMRPYYEERGVKWVEEEKLEHYEKCDLYAIRDGEEVGFLMFLEESGKFYLAELHIYEAHQSHGYGSRAIVWTLKHAAEEGYRKVHVRVFKNNPAYQLYLRHGFSFEKEFPHTDQLVAVAHTGI